MRVTDYTQAHYYLNIYNQCTKCRMYPDKALTLDL